MGSSNRQAALAAAATCIALLGCDTAVRAEPVASAPPKPAGAEEAIFAGGCFWCVETAFEGQPGVLSVTSGYAGGKVDKPTYEQVSAGGTGHAEVVRIVYDPKVTSYEVLLARFWKNIDPLQKDGQFCDHGTQYRSAILVVNEAQRRLAEASRKALVDSKRFAAPVVTEIAPAGTFFPAEEYHQDFWKKDPQRYYSYRKGCGRDERLEALWGEAPAAHPPERKSPQTGESLEPVMKSNEEWKKQLTPEQFQVLREKGTERAFSGKYWNTKTPGVYRCAACGLTLFDSKTKFDSGTGWPSFTQPVGPGHVHEERDGGHGMVRTEVVCARCGGHLGHVFDDGPEPTGLRYCINSAALELAEPDKK